MTRIFFGWNNSDWFDVISVDRNVRCWNSVCCLSYWENHLRRRQAGYPHNGSELPALAEVLESTHRYPGRNSLSLATRSKPKPKVPHRTSNIWHKVFHETQKFSFTDTHLGDHLCCTTWETSYTRHTTFTILLGSHLLFTVNIWLYKGGSSAFVQLYVADLKKFINNKYLTDGPGIIIIEIINGI